MKLIILDRDGVINQESSDFIKTPEEWIPLPKSLEAIRHLHEAGFTITVVTNQSGIGRGLFTEEILEKIHQKMLHEVQRAGGFIDRIYYCPHTEEDGCLCRKPKTGLFEQVQRDYQVDLSQVFAIGDRDRDILAAKNAGCKPILVLNGQTTSEHLNQLLFHSVPVFKNLYDAVIEITRQSDE